jgi:hypothetical protein
MKGASFQTLHRLEKNSQKRGDILCGFFGHFLSVA